ncbi:cytochrome c1 [Luteimonas composti]|uniref:Cytochrome c1 n=1 Tax=Luteimonas composti TaxID=398257 RepID=A0ABT6MV65_9GAMM|nr:cytochrome c1 [Luteimonas composti]MDH7454151.1 cytochrome c1 [Luteimonas composti]
MTKTILSRLAVFATGMLLSFAALAAGGGPVQHAGTDLSDRASLQRGAQLFMNYCAGCHSLKYLRYSRMAEDLGLTEDEVMNNLNLTGAKFGEHIVSSMPAEQASRWFGQVPPDLSLITRVRGSDWVFTYLKSFYLDETRPLGWNNTLFPNASMPNPFWKQQGLQHAVYAEQGADGGDPAVEHLEVASPGTQSAAEFDQTVRDVTAFLEYAGEPAALKRPNIGVWVILFLSFLTLLAWLMKNEYWRDVH